DGDEAVVEHLAKLPPATRGRHAHPALELVERLALVAQRKAEFPAFGRLREISEAAGDVLGICDTEWARVTAPLDAEVTVSAPSGAPRPVGGMAVPFDKKAELAGLLLACDVIADRGRRNALLKNLRRDIRFNLTRNDNDMTDVMNLIDRCL